LQAIFSKTIRENLFFEEIKRKITLKKGKNNPSETILKKYEKKQVKLILRRYEILTCPSFRATSPQAEPKGRKT
jgi:hypothetical protein